MLNKKQIEDIMKNENFIDTISFDKWLKNIKNKDDMKYIVNKYRVILFTFDTEYSKRLRDEVLRVEKYTGCNMMEVKCNPENKFMYPEAFILTSSDITNPKKLDRKPSPIARYCSKTYSFPHIIIIKDGNGIILNSEIPETEVSLDFISSLLLKLDQI